MTGASAVVNFGDPRIEDRIWDKIAPCPTTGCWLWTATFAGAPQIRWKIDGKWAVINVRRIFGELAGVADAKIIIGDCSHCVNPAHYEIFDSASEASLWAAASLRPTYCKHGHSLEDAYEYINGSDGHRYRRCRTCQSLTTAVYANKAFERRVRSMTSHNRARALRRSARAREMWKSGVLRRPDGTMSPRAVLS